MRGAVTVEAVAASLVQGIEKDEPSRLRLQLKLHKPVLVAGRVRKNIEKSCPPIMIAEHQMVGELEHIQTLAQHAVSLAITAIRQIARENAKAHILPILVDVRDTGTEPLHRVESQQFLAVRHYVKIRDLHEFHGPPRYNEQLLRRQKTAAMNDGDQAAAVCGYHYRDRIRATLDTDPHGP